MKKRQLDEAQAECASSAALTAWQTINWVSCEKEVRKLQVRIVEALKANRIGKVKSLQRILISSFSAKALAVRRVTSNSGGSTAGVDKETWLTPIRRYKAISSLTTRGYKPKPLRRHWRTSHLMGWRHWWPNTQPEGTTARPTPTR